MLSPITGNIQLPVPPVCGRSKPRVLMTASWTRALLELPSAAILTALPSTVAVTLVPLLLTTICTGLFSSV